MQLFVRTLDSSTAALYVDANVDVSVLYDLVAQHNGIPVHHQRLIYGGKQLERGSMLSQYSLTSDATVHLCLRLRGGKGGFGSNLRAAGKQKLTDNYDACRDLQGRRIRHTTAMQKLAEWQATAQERELEKIAMQHLKDKSKQERRDKVCEVDVEGVRKEKQAALAGVQAAVRQAVANGLVEGGHSIRADHSGSGGGLKVSGKLKDVPTAKKRRMEVALLGSDIEDSSGDDGGESD